jgi:hypothetical protein
MDRKTSFLILLLLFSFFIVTVSGSNPENNLGKHEDRKNESITQEFCQKCHNATQSNTTSSFFIGNKGIQKPYGMTINSVSSSGNYTTILEVGQTEHQLGFAFRKDSARQYEGWQWWDTDAFGQEKQKNMVVLSILDNSTGTIKPVKGLTNPPTWPRATFRKYSGEYSYKADNDPSPITTQNNYPDMSKFLLMKNVNLNPVGFNLTNATLNFYTWYSMETDWDYAYVSVSTDGVNWDNLPGSRTTTTNPNGNNLGNGITGSSGGIWVLETMELTPYIGKQIFLEFRFISDQEVNAEGMYIDDIMVSGVRYCPPGYVCTQNMYIALDDYAETAPEEKTLSVNVSYPKMTITNYSDPLTALTGFQYDPQVQQVNLQEYPDHPGTYFGYFIYDGFATQYQGNYNVNLSTNIGGTSVTGSTSFKTTMYGCQNCHNKYNNQETSFIHPNHAMGECALVCHTGSRGMFGVQYMGPPKEASPMHLHNIEYGHSGGWSDTGGQQSYNVSAHLNISCQSCHTPFIHDNTGPDTATVASLTLHGTNTTYSSGTHSGMTCENCHGDLSYPNIPQSQHTLSGVLQNYTPSFTSSISFTDTFVVDVNGLENLTISVTGDDKSIWLYAIGPIDNTTTGLMGPCEHGYPCHIQKNLPVSMEIQNPYIGRWLLSLIMMSPEGIANYTITSNYPIERKPIIKIPECNECHSPSSSGKTNSKYEIPNWNLGFAHADTNGDGILDVQCRMCHDSMHNITVRPCQTCHNKAPVSHPVQEPTFGLYTTTQCLTCHGDPHKVGGGSCIACHSNDVNTSKFGRHANMDTSDGIGVVSDKDCGTCHYNKDMNKSNVYLCSSCHSNNTGIVQVNDSTLIVSNLSHNGQTCKSCHAPVKYHMNGTAGPKGLIDILLKNI